MGKNSEEESTTAYALTMLVDNLMVGVKQEKQEDGKNSDIDKEKQEKQGDVKNNDKEKKDASRNGQKMPSVEVFGSQRNGHPVWGDRGSELVFIGVALNEKRIL